MRKCPYCLQEIPEEAKVCKHCSKAVLKSCPACSREIVATAKVCRFCGAGIDAPPRPTLRLDSPCGDRREVILTLVLIFLTCGIYGLWVQYKIGDEINRHQGRNQINPGLDLLLVFLTCGLWGVYTSYKYPKVLEEMSLEEGGARSDLAVLCLLFTLLGLHLVAILILQSELNKHWELHRSTPA
jgi:hypothetical protein